MMKKKLLSIVLTVMLILSVVPFGAFSFTVSAATSGTTGECTWTIDGTTLIISGNGKMEDYNSFMSTPWYYNIFYNDIVITNAIIEDGVKNIGSNSFSWCSYLEKVTISASVETIGAGAFSNCYNLTVITIAENNNNLCLLDNVVYDKGITTLILYPATKSDTTYEIPNTVTKIQESAFHNCDSLKSVTIGGNVSTIEGNVFSGCNMLESITVSNDNVHYYSNDGVLFSCDDAALLLYPAKKTDTKYTVPVGVKKIASGAFGSCNNIQNLEISEGASIIDDYAITWCENLVAVNIPSSVTKIGLGAFDGCYNISDVYISDLAAWCAIDNMSLFLQYTERMVLNGDVITDLVIPEGVISIGENAFTCYGALESVVLPDGITSIGRYAFGDCDNLKNIVIPDSVVTIDEYAFFCMNGSSLTDVWYTGSQSDREDIMIGSANTPLESATWHYDTCNVGVTGDCVWYLDGTTLTISGNGAMADYEYGYGAFLAGTNAPWDTTVVTTVIIEDGVNNIGNYAFCGGGINSTIENVVIADSVTSIGKGAFYSTYSLKEITLPDSITHIGSDAFEDCRQMQTINLPENLISIGDRAFYMCPLDDVIIPASVTSIGLSAFSNGCANIEVDESNNYYGSIDGVLFNKDATILIQYPSFKFQGKYIIPDTVEIIGSEAFECCGEMEIVISENVIKIEDNAFYDCFDITIRGFKNSVAEAYAKGNDISFVSMVDVEVTAPSGVVDENAQLVVEEISEEEAIEKLPDEIKITNVMAIDIYFELGGEIIQPNGTVTVEIDVPTGFKGEYCEVYHIANDGTILKMNARYQDEKLVFDTPHFSIYVIVENVPAYTPGDANGDGKINNKDIVRLQQYLAEWDVEIVEDCSDVDGNGKVNNRDLVRLQQYLADWDVKLG